MKLQFKQIEPFVKAPDPKARVILVYGPDDGLVRERAAAMGKTVVADLNDPFNAVTLDAGQLADDPARLMDEALAMSMMGGNRSLSGVFLGAEIMTDRVHDNIQQLIDDAAKGELEVVIDKVFPLSDAAGAHAYIESRAAVGRVVMVP